MKIKFCGAATGVTGSCHLIEGEGHRILLDCGQFQGGRAQEKLNAEPFPFDIDQIEDVVLSNAHIQHSLSNLPLPLGDMVHLQAGREDGDCSHA